MQDDERFKALAGVLKEFQSAGILKDLILVGNWCFYFYHLEFQVPIPDLKADEVDFQIPAPKEATADSQMTPLMKRMGFAPTLNRSNDFIVYDHPDLRVEFLASELGRNFDHAREIRRLNIKAEALRHLNILAEHPRTIAYDGMEIRVPQPAIFALHKLIVCGRPPKKEKEKKELEAAFALFDCLFPRPEELERMKAILKTLPKASLHSIQRVAENSYPKLAELAATFF